MLERLNEGNNRQKLDRILEKLELYYPEHKVFALDSIDKTLRENISILSSVLGFQNSSEFLTQIGYKMIKGEEVRVIRNKVIYTPGNEPEGIKNKVDNILNRLNEYYPDKEINRGIQKEHKALSLNISGMYQWLGYDTIKSFLEAYGYKYNIESEVGGRPSNDYDDLIEYLISKYSNNPIYSNVLDLINNEVEYSSKLKTLANRGPKVLGVSLKQFLIDKNVLIREISKTEMVTLKRQEEKDKKEKLIKDKIYEKCLNGNCDINVELSKYDDLIIDYRVNGDLLLLKGIKNKKEVLEIPYGINKITDSFYNSLEGVEKLVVSESVQSLNYYGLNDIVSLKEIILKKPKFKMRDEFFDRFIISLDVEKRVNEYLKSIDSGLYDKYLYYVDVLLKCLRVAHYNKKIKFFIDRDFKLAFLNSKKVYFTNIILFDDIIVFDKILENIFEMNWLYGYIDRYSGYRKLEKVKLNDRFNIVEGEKNEN